METLIMEEEYRKILSERIHSNDYDWKKFFKFKRDLRDLYQSNPKEFIGFFISYYKIKKGGIVRKIIKNISTWDKPIVTVEMLAGVLYINLRQNGIKVSQEEIAGFFGITGSCVRTHAKKYCIDKEVDFYQIENYGVCDICKTKMLRKNLIKHMLTKHTS